MYNLDSIKKSHKWMRKFNVSMDMFGNTKEKREKKMKKEVGNVTMKI